MMPTYLYRCRTCGMEREIRAPMSAIPTVVVAESSPCPEWEPKAPGDDDAHTLERVYTPVATNVPGGTPIHHDRAWLRYGQAAKSQERKG